MPFQQQVIAALLGFLLFTPWSLAADQEVLSGVVLRSNDSLLWGAYRPNLYFGMKPRIPKSVSTGLLWAKVDSYEQVQQRFRYTCEQHSGMAGYGWDEYDVRAGGKQTIHDADNSLDITTELVKFPGGQHGGSWGVRIKGKPRDEESRYLPSTILFSITLEGEGELKVTNEPDELGIEGSVNLAGNTPELGEFKIEITTGPETNAHPPSSHKTYADKPLDRTLVTSMQLPNEHLWQTKTVMFQHMKSVIDAYVEDFGDKNSPPPWQVYTIKNKIQPGNMHLIQKVFAGEFEFDVLFSSASSGEALSSDGLAKGIEEMSKSFDSQFKSSFPLAAPFNKSKYKDFARSMFSNLAGGIGYFYGEHVVDRSNDPAYLEENEGFAPETLEARTKNRIQLEGPFELFTSIPSRPFFPRGFLWDEGFHLLPIADFDMDLTLEIVKSWFKLMDDDGWIAREQILGLEARSKVPPEFTIQYPHYANPPTLYLVLDAFINKLDGASSSSSTDTPDQYSELRNKHLRGRETAISYLKELYPLLKRQFFWFKTTQYGDIKSYDREAFSTKEAYRWRGRTEQHCLTSGLDDYPRPQPPHPGELHTDLISWMGIMAKSILRIAKTIDEKDDIKEFEGYAGAIARNIDDLHWNKEANTFCDATIDDYEEHIHVCRKGYISIFPFMAGLLPPDSPRLKAILDLIQDPEELWSEYGVRSLSKKDQAYGTEENYWRSPIWMNMNYLIVKNILTVAQSSSPHKKQATEMYTKLRQNLVDNVFAQWEKTGFAWEQYNPETGKGQRTQHFTGWTSLIVKIMTMPDLSGKAHDEL